MSLSSLHTHTIFCDGTDDVETFCRRAWEKGLHSLGFSAHGPISKKTGIASGWHLPEDRLEAYLRAVQEARSRWAGRLRVYLGLEVDYIEGLTGPADGEYRGMGLDYLIGAVHYLIPPRGKPFAADDSPLEFAEGVRLGYGGDGEGAMEAYWDAVEGMIRAGGFDILGHVDLIKKNVRKTGETGQWFDMAGEAYRRRLSRIVPLIAGAGPAALEGKGGFITEVNTGGINRGKTPDTYPALPVLKMLAPQGGQGAAPVIITADAHQAEDLDGHYAEARETLRLAGYRETFLLEGRQNGRPQWKAEPLPDR